MATTKKYISLSKLTKYDELLKAKMAADDASILAQAKAYCDNKDDQFEAAGAVATAKEALQKSIDAVEAKADAASAANATTQSDLDKLEALVGTLPDTATATDVVGYVNEKTYNIASQTTLQTVINTVAQAERDIDAIEAEYLKAADKTELNDLITAEKTRAEGIESGLRTDVNAVKADYLKASDKTALEASIAAAKKAGDDAQADIDAFLASAEIGDAAIDTLKEIQDYITSDGQAAATMTANIKQNADDIDSLETAVAAKAAQSDLADEISARTSADSALDTRLKAVESAVGTSGSVATDIATAKQEAIDSAVATAASDATSKANKALADAKSYADGLDTAMDERVDVLESATHTHANKTELDLIATGDKAKWDAAAGKAHEHSNKTVLDGITAAKVSDWDAAEQNAKTYADGLNTAMAARMDAVEAWQTNMVEVSEAEVLALFN